MRTLHLLHAEAIRSPPARRSFKSVRCIHRSSPAQTNNGRSRKPQAQHVSLYDELFPEEKDLAGTTSAASKDEDIEIPRLPLSDLEHFEPFYRRSGDSQYPATESTEASAQESAKQWNPAVLVLSRASKSLVDADFRRIAPKGRHIEEWTGLGDILKVIPGRDPTTFQQRNHYFLLFSNPAYARTYQDHVTKLHTLAQTHTPTSLRSSLPPVAGTIVEGEDAHTFLQDYALCPPSQRISLSSMFTPFGNTVKPLIEHQGYPQLTASTIRAGRAVLFWIDGHAPTTPSVRAAIHQDGRDRGLPWATEGGSRSIEKLNLPTTSPEDLETPEQAESSEVRGRSSARWIVTFVDENEARRFVRAWHKRPFPLNGDPVRGEDAPLVNAEFLW